MRGKTAYPKATHGDQCEAELTTGDLPDLEAAFLAEISRARAHDRLRPIVVLVGSHLLGLHLRRHLADNAVPHLNIRFLTLDDLAEAVAARTISERRKTRVPAVVPEQMLASIALRLAAEDRDYYFKTISDRPGFHRALRATICDLKEACLRPEHLASALGSLNLAGADRSKVFDLLKTWEHYEEWLARLDWVDSADVMMMACEAVAASPLVCSAASIMAYGLYDFNAVQKRLVETCLSVVPVKMFMPYQPTRAFEYARPTVAWLEGLGFKHRHVGRDESGPAVLGHLRQHLFEPPGAAVDAGDALTIMSAPGEVREVQEVLRSITEEAHRSGQPLYRVGVLLRNPDEYSGIFRDALERIDLRPYIPAGRRLSETRAGRSLLLLMEVFRSGFRRQAVMDFATFAPLRSEQFAARGSPAPSPLEWEMISMDAGVVEGAPEWDERLRMLLEDQAEDRDLYTRGRHRRRYAPGAVQSLRRFVGFLSNSLSDIGRARSWSGMAEHLVEAFSVLVAADDVAPEISIAVREIRHLDRLGTRPSWDEFLRIAGGLLEAATVEIGRSDRSGPAVLGLMDARCIPFRSVVIPGLVERSFPSPPRQDAILLDREREVLNLALTGSPLGPLNLKARHRLDEERLLFRLAVGSARDRLLLTFPRLEAATARDRLPSSFLLATADAIRGHNTDFAQLDRCSCFTRVPLSRVATEHPEEALDSTEYDLSAAVGAIAGKDRSPIDHLRHLNRFFDLAVRFESARWGERRFTPYDGVFETLEAKAALRAGYAIVDRAVSPTSLETFASCPYRYLLGTVLGIGALAEPERVQEIDPGDRGSMIHAILCEFFTALRSKQGESLRVSTADVHLLRETAERVFAEFEKRGLTGFSAVWEVGRAEVLACLERVLEEEAEEPDFSPSYFEVRFGTRGKGSTGRTADRGHRLSSEEPIPVAVGRRRVFIKGRIDRIDVSRGGTRARVIDYKSGGNPFAAGRGENNMAGGKALQLPLYLVAAEHLLTGPSRIPLVARSEYYYIFEDDKKRRVRFDHDALVAQMPELERILATIAECVEKGIFLAVPDGGCRTCDFITICGDSREAIFGRKRADGRVAGFLALGRDQTEEGPE